MMIPLDEVLRRLRLASAAADALLKERDPVGAWFDERAFSPPPGAALPPEPGGVLSPLSG
jgi:hypothetical protein